MLAGGEFGGKVLFECNGVSLCVEFRDFGVCVIYTLHNSHSGLFLGYLVEVGSVLIQHLIPPFCEFGLAPEIALNGVIYLSVDGS